MVKLSNEEYYKYSNIISKHKAEIKQILQNREIKNIQINQNRLVLFVKDEKLILVFVLFHDIRWVISNLILDIKYLEMIPKNLPDKENVKLLEFEILVSILNNKINEDDRYKIQMRILDLMPILDGFGKTKKYQEIFGKYPSAMLN